jgi:mono/diheme cytochrome c family protein
MKGIYQKYISKRITLYTACIVLLIIAGSSFTNDDNKKKDEAAYKTSQQAFLEVYKVLMSPRCMNCHPSGDVPLQGDDSHLHTMNVQRGTDGKGMYAMKCSNCHQPENTPGLNMPPGNPQWHLPPANMKMVFQGRTPKQLAMQLKDPKQNGGKTLEQLYHHVAEDELVLWGWKPGDGRTLPPLSHDEFAKAFRTWIDNGAAIPD